MRNYSVSLKKLIFAFAMLTIFIDKAGFAAKQIHLEGELDGYEVYPHIEILEDKEKTWQLNDIISPPQMHQFVPNRRNLVNLGRSNSAFWLRFTIQNNNERPAKYIFEVLKQPGIYHTTMYVITPDNQTIEKKIDGFKPISEREWKQRDHLYTLSFDQQGLYKIHLRVDSEFRQLFFPLKLYSPASFYRFTSAFRTIMGCFYGVIIGSVIYNVFLFFTLKNRCYLYYILSCLSFGAMSFCGDGFTVQYLWPESPWLDQAAVWSFIGCANFWSILFSRSFLKVSDTFKRLDRYLVVLLLFSLSLIILPAFAKHSTVIVKFLTYLNTSLSIIASLSMLIIGYMVWRRGYIPARFYLFGWIAVFFAGTSLALAFLDIIPMDYFVYDKIRLAVAWEIIFFSLALAEKIKILKQQEREAWQRALSEEKEKLQAQNSSYANLEKANQLQAEMLAIKAKVDKLKDDFLTVTSHELSSPVHGIIGLTDVLKQDAIVQQSPSLKKSIHFIHFSARQLMYLVNDILDFVRLKHRDVELKYKLIGIYEASEVVLHLSQSLIGHKSINLVNLVPSNLPKVNADEDRLQDIMLNLVKSAIDHMESGSITISARVIQSTMEVEILHTGSSIPDEINDSLFKRSSTTELAFSHHNKKLGLGLSITKKLVHLHGGDFTFKSSDNQSSFFFTLPLATELKSKEPTILQLDKIPRKHFAEIPEVVNETNDSSSHELLKSNILIVDDDPVNLEFMTVKIEKSGFKPLSASCGQQALEYLNNDAHPNLVLLNVLMPGMNGFEWLDTFRKMPGMTAVPVIFLSTKNQVAELPENIDLGTNDFLIKPFSGTELISRIRSRLFIIREKQRIDSIRDLPRLLEECNTEKDQTKKLFETVVKNIDCDGAALYDEVNITKPSLSVGRLASHPQIHLRKLDLTSEQSIVINRRFETSGIYQSEPQPGDFSEKINLLVAKNPEISSSVLILSRNENYYPFDEHDRTFLENVFKEKKQLRCTVQKLMKHSEQITIFNKIQEILHQIQYIRSASPYIEVIKDINENEVEDFLVSIGKTAEYFGKDDLLRRVHKSYLVNPRKVISISRIKTKFKLSEEDIKILRKQGLPDPLCRLIESFSDLIPCKKREFINKLDTRLSKDDFRLYGSMLLDQAKKNSPDYEVVLSSAFDSTRVIPVGRKYLRALKKDFPGWFRSSKSLGKVS